MHRFFKSEFFNFEFLRILSTTAQGGCEIAEALIAAERIQDESPSSWSVAWQELGAAVEIKAQEAKQKGDHLAARGAFLRASNYLRASQYMLNDSSPKQAGQSLSRLERSKELFRNAVLLLNDITVHTLSIPYQNDLKLPAYLYIPHEQLESKRKDAGYPLVINLCGGDSTQEETFLVSAYPGIQRGYAVLTFEGPGQGILLKRDKVPMEAEFEKVGSVVLDYLELLESIADTRLGIDMNRMAVVGQSLGAYFALRMAIDPRIKVCVAIDPPYDMWELAISRMPSWFINAWVRGFISDERFNSIVSFFSKFSFQLQWEVAQMGLITGAANAADAFRGLRQYTLQSSNGGEHLHGSECAMMISGALNSMYFSPEENSVRVFRSLEHLGNSRKKLWIADAIDNGGLQAKVGAFELANHRIFDWCAEHL